MINRLLFSAWLLIVSSFVSAQIVNTATMDTLETTVIGHLGVGGYVDSYYGYNFNKPANGNVPYFVSSARHNEFTINLAYIDLRYRSSNFRARFVPGAGTYMNANYAAEPGTLKNLVEANVGVRLSAKRNFWLDVGVLGSPYTNESAISKDHLMYTRSFAPENVPYYLSGAKLTMPLNNKWSIYLYLLNGWQVIQDNNSGKSFGSQIEFRPNKKMLFNWNTYVGDERSSTRPDFRTRLFSDLFWIFKPNEKVDITSSAYIGWQSIDNQSTASWWQANLIGRYTFNDLISLSARIEYFHDPNGTMQQPITSFNKFQVFSSGACLNVKANHNALIRFDVRNFTSVDPVFQDESLNSTTQSWWAVMSLTAWF